MPEKPSSLFVQLLQQASTAAHHHPAIRTQRFAQGPRAGSATSRVLGEMQSVAPAFLSQSELQARLGLSRGAVCWALKFLNARGDIVAVDRIDRPPYRRYRAKVQGDG